MKAEPSIAELRPGIYQIWGEKPGSHVYLIRGLNKNVLIDTGITANFPQLKGHLKKLGVSPGSIDIVMLSHEHFDHIGASAFFFDTAVLAAHRLAANKIGLRDEFVTLNRYRNIPSKPFHVHLWLEDAALIDLGNYRLQVIHSPGHTSGCICIYEPDERLLFSGDTVFAKGTLSEIATSGSISDYVSSLRRLGNLRIAEMYPGHGGISLDAEGDIKRAVEYAQAVMEDSKTLFDALTKTGSRLKVFDKMLKRPWSGVSRPPKDSQKHEGESTSRRTI